jgi:hypothetical protein
MVCQKLKAAESLARSSPGKVSARDPELAEQLRKKDEQIEELKKIIETAHSSAAQMHLETAAKDFEIDQILEEHAKYLEEIEEHAKLTKRFEVITAENVALCRLLLA